jgi:uncharacterized protein (UPF0333 family)
LAKQKLRLLNKEKQLITSRMNAKRKRAQIAAEYISLTTFLLAIITIIAAFSFTTFFDAVKHRMLDDSINALSERINEAHSLGKGTVLFVQISLPEGIISTEVNGQRVGYKFQASSGPTDYWNAVDANVSGSLPTKDGKHIIKISYLDQNVVLSEYTGG